MANRRVRIIPKRREVVDAARLAEALLDLIEHLGPEDKVRYLAEGQRILDEDKGGGQPTRGSAA